MRVRINGIECLIPSSLSEITLKQKIDFQIAHGNELDAMSKSIQEIEDEDDKELEQLQFNIISIFRTLSFFLPFDIESLKQTEHVQSLVNIYTNSIALLNQQEKYIEENPVYEFTWLNDEWELHTPELNQGDKMTFGELIDAKQIVQDMLNAGKNRWECMLSLCAIFLRKKNEPYEDRFVYPNSERLKLMEQLPMDIALQVGFFLSASLSLYTKIFQSSTLPEQKIKQENIQKNISHDLVG